jgi:hypothetical protein
MTYCKLPEQVLSFQRAEAAEDLILSMPYVVADTRGYGADLRRCGRSPRRRRRVMIDTSPPVPTLRIHGWSDVEFCRIIDAKDQQER